MRPPGTEAWVATAGTESFSSGDGLRKGGWFRNAAVIYLHLSGHQFGDQQARHVAGCFGAGARRAARRGIRLGARLLRRGPGRRGGRPPGELPQDSGPECPVRRPLELPHLAVRGGAAHGGGAVAPGRAALAAAARRGASPRPPALRIAAAAAVIAALGVTVVLAGRGRRGIPIDLARARWQAPSDFLLRVPGAELLRTVPELGRVTLPFRYVDTDWRTP